MKVETMNGREIITKILTESLVIEPEFTGQIVIHFGCGRISEVECIRKKKGHLEKIEKKFLDFYENCAKKV